MGINITIKKIKKKKKKNAGGECTQASRTD